MHSEHKCCGCKSSASADYRSIIRRYDQSPGNLIPMLHDLNDEIGYLPGSVMEEVAAYLSMPLSDVYGTATFYTLFKTEPKGDHIVMLCDSPPCHLEGSRTIRKALEEELGIKPGETTPDGKFTFEIVSCMGLCGVAPAIMIDHEAYGNLSPEMIPGILARYRGEEG